MRIASAQAVIEAINEFGWFAKDDAFDEAIRSLPPVAIAHQRPEPEPSNATRPLLPATLPVSKVMRPFAPLLRMPLLWMILPPAALPASAFFPAFRTMASAAVEADCRLPLSVRLTFGLGASDAVSIPSCTTVILDRNGSGKVLACQWVGLMPTSAC